MLDLENWKTLSDIRTTTLWIDAERDRSGVHAEHNFHGGFIPQIPNQIIRRFTQPGDWVLDPFLGMGTTLVEAQRLGRNGIGIEIQSTIAYEADQVVHKEPANGTQQVVVHDNATEANYAEMVREFASPLQAIQACILHPPYHSAVAFSGQPGDLSCCPSVEAFLASFRVVVQKCTDVLDPKGYIALVMGDIYQRGEVVPLGFLAMQSILAFGYNLRGIVVKNLGETQGKARQRSLWRYRNLRDGTFTFAHEYLFVMRRR